MGFHFQYLALSLWSGTSCCDDISGGPPPPDYDGPTVLRSPRRTPLMRKYRFVVGPGVAIDGSGEVPAVASGPYHMYESPLLREPADVTSLTDVTSFVGCDVGSHNLASISSWNKLCDNNAVLISAPSLGVLLFLSLTLSACLSLCLFVTSIASFLFLDGIEPFLGHQFSLTKTSKRCSSTFFI